MRKSYDAKFKKKVVLEALKENETMAQLSSRFEVNRVQIQSWKKQCVDNLSLLFSSKADDKKERQQTELVEELYKQIGMLKVENDFLKKKFKTYC